MEKRIRKKSLVRHLVQAAFFALTNGYAAGFLTGKIYRGPTKAVCVPGLNCYSCPGALMACPIGSLQAVFQGKGFNLSCYVFGLIMAFGTICGRFVCGWLCPFGLVQDLLHKIPLFKKKKGLPGHKYLKYLKYAVLALMVIVLPLAVKNFAGLGDPWFCEYICPSGTLFAGIPLLAANKTFLGALGSRFILKASVLVLIVVLSIKYYRPFCKYLCPLGALYGFFNPIAFFRYTIDKDSCIKCGSCTEACRMGINVMENVNSEECIRCGDCKAACQKDCISNKFMSLR
ncbi:MAG: 4Fe-4S binding protein [Parasporobacterium sp.]|nr:4Fe-4S binding protein [Parasporobacterium sp.]